MLFKREIELALALVIGIVFVGPIFAYEIGDIPVTRWVDSSGGKPITYQEYYSLHPKTTLPFEINLEKITTPDIGDSSLIFIMVNSFLYAEVDSSIAQYIQDLGEDGYWVRLYTSSGGTPSDLRAFLKDHLAEGLNGCVLVGDFPIPWYQMYEDWGEGEEYEEFPIDLYYMDLDGIWTDSNSDGMFDEHSGDVEPEIWIGRLTSSPLVYSGDSEAELVRNYFRKKHEFRIDNFPIERRALLYVDDDWEFSAEEWDNELNAVYNERSLVAKGDVTVAKDYKRRLTHGYELIQLHAHSTSHGHYFKIRWDDEDWSGGYIMYWEIVSVDPVALFYNLFACSNCRYVEGDYMGGWYIFTPTYGLGAIGSTKTGSMLNFEDFYTPLSQYKSLGESFREWFAINGETSRQWFYGMTLLGDPTLKLKTGVPLSSFKVDDDDSGESNGDNNGRINSGETIELNLALENCDAIEHKDVSASISSSDSFVYISDSTAFYWDIPGHSIAEGLDDFVLSVSPFCPDSHRVLFLVDVKGEDEGRWKSYFGMTVVNPVLLHFANTIEDVEGNNNVRADPGETCNLYLMLKNSGGEDAVGITTTISTMDSFVTFIDNYGEFQDIPAGSLGTNLGDPFRFVVDSSSTLHLAYCILHITANDGFHIKDIKFGLEIGEPQVLLVVDDGGTGNSSYYSQVLDSIGVVYRKLVNTEASVPEDTLMGYKDVIWFTGEECSNTLTEDDRSHLMDYLDRGGNLFLTGQWGLYDIRDTDFYSDYLYADFLNFSTGLHHLNGVEGNPLVGDLSISLSTTDPNGQICPGEIDPITPAFSVFKYDTTTGEGTGDIRSSGTGAIGVDTETYRLVFFAFGFEGIEPFKKRVTVIKGVLNWLEGVTGIGDEFGGNRPGIPKAYSLSQNYPNPFNPTTVIRYQLAADCGRPSAVTLQVYNILGQEVRTLVDGKQPAGNYQVLWDGRDGLGKDVSSGVYFYRLKVDGQRLKVERTRKMILLR